ncbi:glycine-rich repeat-containing protein [Cryptosporidium canis]|uniref:Glycine-rich repeat-containing protein n=1 Tax=Cryptosporidium canis TaxID=195482 RepID=A0A9D5HXH2_9CRYT|nr:glycine-rich repeat-containing protein [Cryptosporidium canis]
MASKPNVRISESGMEIVKFSKGIQVQARNNRGTRYLNYKLLIRKIRWVFEQETQENWAEAQRYDLIFKDILLRDMNRMDAMYNRDINYIRDLIGILSRDIWNLSFSASCPAGQRKFGHMGIRHGNDSDSSSMMFISSLSSIVNPEAERQGLPQETYQEPAERVPFAELPRVLQRCHAGAPEQEPPEHDAQGLQERPVLGHLPEVPQEDQRTDQEHLQPRLVLEVHHERGRDALPGIGGGTQDSGLWLQRDDHWRQSTDGSVNASDQTSASTSVSQSSSSSGSAKRLKNRPFKNCPVCHARWSRNPESLQVENRFVRLCVQHYLNTGSFTGISDLDTVIQSAISNVGFISSDDETDDEFNEDETELLDFEPKSGDNGHNDVDLGCRPSTIHANRAARCPRSHFNSGGRSDVDCIDGFGGDSVDTDHHGGAAANTLLPTFNHIFGTVALRPNSSTISTITSSNQSLDGTLSSSGGNFLMSTPNSSLNSNPSNSMENSGDGNLSHVGTDFNGSRRLTSCFGDGGLNPLNQSSKPLQFSSASLFLASGKHKQGLGLGSSSGIGLGFGLNNSMEGVSGTNHAFHSSNYANHHKNSNSNKSNTANANTGNSNTGSFPEGGPGMGRFGPKHGKNPDRMNWSCPNQQGSRGTQNAHHAQDIFGGGFPRRDLDLGTFPQRPGNGGPHSKNPRGTGHSALGSQNKGAALDVGGHRKGQQMLHKKNPQTSEYSHFCGELHGTYSYIGGGLRGRNSHRGQNHNQGPSMGLVHPGLLMESLHTGGANPMKSQAEWGLGLGAGSQQRHGGQQSGPGALYSEGMMGMGNLESPCPGFGYPGFHFNGQFGGSDGISGASRVYGASSLYRPMLSKTGGGNLGGEYRGAFPADMHHPRVGGDGSIWSNGGGDYYHHLHKMKGLGCTGGSSVFTRARNGKSGQDKLEMSAGKQHEGGPNAGEAHLPRAGQQKSHQIDILGGFQYGSVFGFAEEREDRRLVGKQSGRRDVQTAVSSSSEREEGQMEFEKMAGVPFGSCVSNASTDIGTGFNINFGLDLDFDRGSLWNASRDALHSPSPTSEPKTRTGHHGSYTKKSEDQGGLKGGRSSELDVKSELYNPPVVGHLNMMGGGGASDKKEQDSSYSWNPFTGDSLIGSGESIKKYISDNAGRNLKSPISFNYKINEEVTSSDLNLLDLFRGLGV